MRQITIIIITVIFDFLCPGNLLALDIEGIEIWHSKDYYDGLPVDSTPWDFGVSVRGAGIIV